MNRSKNSTVVSLEEIEAFAMIMASRIRICVVAMLNPRAASFGDMQTECSHSLGREVSDGSLNWHIVKLMAAGILQKTPEGFYALTSRGIKLVHVIKDVKEKLDSEGS